MPILDQPSRRLVNEYPNHVFRVEKLFFPMLKAVCDFAAWFLHRPDRMPLVFIHGIDLNSFKSRVRHSVTVSGGWTIKLWWKKKVHSTPSVKGELVYARTTIVSWSSTHIPSSRWYRLYRVGQFTWAKSQISRWYITFMKTTMRNNRKATPRALTDCCYA